MASRKTLNTALQWWNGKKSFQDDSDPPWSNNQENGSSSQSRILDIEKAERAKRAALAQCAERLCASQKAHSNAVLERLGFSILHDTIPTPQPAAFPSRNPDSSLRQRRIRPIITPFNMEDSGIGQTPRTSQASDEEDPILEKTLCLGCQMPVTVSNLDKLTAKNRTPSPHTSNNSVDTISSVDTHTPSGLRVISQLGNFTPTPPPTAATRRVSRIPVMSVKVGGVGKKVADKCKFQSAKTKVEELMEKVEQLKVVHFPAAPPPAAPRKTPVALIRPLAAVTLMVPTPPTATLTNRKGPRLGTNLRPLKADSGDSENDLQPLVNPSESLSLIFKELNPKDWEKKVNRLKSVQALARHHQELLQAKLHEVCLVLEEEVANLRPAVACAAIEAVAELHINVGKAMDPEAETTGRALLLKLAQTTNVFIHQKVNLALDALVEACSPGRIMNALLSTGLSHRCVAVRGSAAQRLHQLADIIGEDRIFTSGKIFAECFLTAVSKMSVDAAPEVRHHGRKMLQGLAQQTEFVALWSKVIPVKDRRLLQKFLMKMKNRKTSGHQI